jgi:gamma-glutamyl:cysteine ligase YbdK (ATP-grasp superfamily)
VHRLGDCVTRPALATPTGSVAARMTDTIHTLASLTALVARLESLRAEIAALSDHCDPARFRIERERDIGRECNFNEIKAASATTPAERHLQMQTIAIQLGDDLRRALGLETKQGTTHTDSENGA